MKIFYHLTFSAVLAFLAVSAMAAPVESVESARASVALQKVDSFLCEKAVVDQLATLGVSLAEAQARVAKLDDRQLEQLAAQIDLLQAGGKIASGHVDTLGPVGCVLRQIRDTFVHIFQILFCWTDIK